MGHLNFEERSTLSNNDTNSFQLIIEGQRGEFGNYLSDSVAKYALHNIDP
jgi:hypothetical protein